jgi:hypothetical protein
MKSLAQDSSYINEAQEALVKLLEPRRHPAKDLYALKKVFNKMPRKISCRIQRPRQRSIASRWNDCLHAAGKRQFDDCVGVIPLVGEKCSRRQAFYQFRRLANIGEIARRQFEEKRITQRVANSVNFGVQSATRDANRLGAAFFWAPEET